MARVRQEEVLKLRGIVSSQRQVLHKLIQRSPREVPREVLSSFKKHLAEPLMKVITGPRRAGKSTFALQLLAGRKFAYLNFDDDNLVGLIRTMGTAPLLPALREVYGDFSFLFFDEIQNIDDWELFCNRLHREGHNLLITGSNAHLLSHELASHLTGRFVELRLLPFSWTEFRVARPTAPFSDYLDTGGFPEVVMQQVEGHTYLRTLVDSIILKDIVGRYSIRFTPKLRELYLYLSESFTKEYSISKLSRVLDFSSKTTLQKYFGYFIETYLLYDLKRYSHKLKEQLKAPRKVYLMDNGLAFDEMHTFDASSRKLENMVFIHLLRASTHPEHDLFYYRTKRNSEVDFLVKDGRNVKALIQVAYSLKNHSTWERESRALVEAAEELRCDRCQVITLDPSRVEKIGNIRIEIVHAEEWLA